MVETSKVRLTDVETKMGLVCLTPDVDYEAACSTVPEVNRPALQLAGFFDEFDNDRIQIIGNVEFSYLNTLKPNDRLNRYRQVFMCDIPCIVYCRNLEPVRIPASVNYIGNRAFAGCSFSLSENK